MSFRKCLLSLGLFLLPIWSWATVNEGYVWLQSQQQADGSIRSSTDQTHAVSATLAALRTAILTQGLTLNTNSAYAFLNGANTLHLQHLAGLEALGLLQSQPQTISEALALRANSDGGYGDLPGYGSTAFDTAFALEILLRQSREIRPALNYLLAQQNDNGSWSLLDGPGNPFITSKVLEALQPLTDQYLEVAEAVNRSNSFLLNARQATGGWGEAATTARCLFVLTQTLPDPTILATDVEALLAAQSDNGSWDQDVFTTAEVLRALWLYDLTIGETDSGSLIGSLVWQHSQRPVVGARVSLLSQPGLVIESDTQGRFDFSLLEAGMYTLIIEGDGLITRHTYTQVVAGSTADTGVLAVAALANRSNLTGRLQLSNDALPSQVRLTLNGAEYREISVFNDGSFAVNGVFPGSYNLEAQLNGFHAINRTITLNANQTLDLQLQMVALGTPLLNESVVLSGRVLDHQGSLLENASVQLNGDRETTTDAQGRFSFAAVTRGDINLQLAADGFLQQRVHAYLAAGGSGQLGDLILFPNVGETAPDQLQLLVQVSARDSGAALSGATVTLAGLGSAPTDAFGRVTFTGINQNQLNVTATAPGFLPQTRQLTNLGSGRVATHLSLLPEGDDGATGLSLSGVVTDRDTGDPIVAADVIEANSGMVVQTDPSGLYQFVDLPQQRVDLVVNAEGYKIRQASVTYTAFGDYNLDLDLQTEQAIFQIVAIEPTAYEVAANTELPIRVRVKNLDDTPRTARVNMDLNYRGVRHDRPVSRDPETGQLVNDITFQAGEERSFDFTWFTGQAKPGNHQVQVWIFSDETVSFDHWEFICGRKVTKDVLNLSVRETYELGGALAFDPPVAQAGEVTQVTTNVLLRNAGNMVLPAGDYRLLIRDSQAQTVFSAVLAQSAMPVGDLRQINFGTWTPAQAGSFDVTVTQVDMPELSPLEQSYLVGNVAEALFTIAPGIVADGDQTVSAQIRIQNAGQQVVEAQDPLLALVEEALERGLPYVTNTTLAEHATGISGSGSPIFPGLQIQTVHALSRSSHQVATDTAANRLLANSIAHEMTSSGRIASTGFDYYSTPVALWSLMTYPEAGSYLRTKLKAADYLYREEANRATAGQLFWPRRGGGGWWSSDQAVTAITTQSLLKLAAAVDRGDFAEDDHYERGTAVDTFLTPLDLLSHDGEIIMLSNAGAITRVAYPSGQRTTILPYISGTTPLSFAVDEQNRYYIGGPTGQIMRRTLADERITGDTGDHELAGLVVGLDGFIYAASRNTDEILKISADLQTVEVVASAGLLARPTDLDWFDEDTLMVANSNGQNLLLIDLDGSVEVYAEGFQDHLHRVAVHPNGDVWVSDFGSGSTTQSVAVVKPNRTLNKLPDLKPLIPGNSGANMGLTVLDGTVYTCNFYRPKLWTYQPADFDLQFLDDFKAELPQVAAYLLTDHQNTEVDLNLVVFRLIGLLECLPHLPNGSQRDAVTDAISFLTDHLKSRQADNGGWPTLPGRPTNGGQTAWALAALEASGVTIDDAAYRNGLMFLVSQQQANGSWPGGGWYVSELGQSTAVLGFLPGAHERLGNLSAELEVQFADDTTPADFTRLANETDQTGDLTRYRWSFADVSQETIDIDFNLTATDMVFGEDRPAAVSANLILRNTFAGGEVMRGIDIPLIRSVSDLQMTITSSSANYGANEDATFAIEVRNNGPLPESGNLILEIRDPISDALVAELPSQTLTSLASGARFETMATWHTGDVLVGDYVIRGRVLNSSQKQTAFAEGTFAIEGDTSPAALQASVLSDKPRYRQGDQVALVTRLNHLTTNAVFPQTLNVLDVRDANLATVYETSFGMPTLAPGESLERFWQMPLEAPSFGTYQARLRVFDANGEQLLDQASATFEVIANPTFDFSGQVTTNPRQVDRGEAVSRTDQVELLADQSRNVTLMRRLVHFQSEQVLQEVVENYLLQPGQTLTLEQTIDTATLVGGEYICQLLLQDGADSYFLGAAGFQVIEENQEVPCGDCSTQSVVVIEENTTIDLSGAFPALIGDQSLVPYVSAIKEGENPADWKAILNLDQRNLQMAEGVSLTVATVAYQSGFATPGLDIRNLCSLELQAASDLYLAGDGVAGGDLRIHATGDLRIAGTIRNDKLADQGQTGDLILQTTCGDITVEPTGLVALHGTYDGGGDLELNTLAGDIAVKGLLDASYVHSPAPKIRLIANGNIHIEGDHRLGVEADTSRTISSGITNRSLFAATAGPVELIAMGDVSIDGFGSEDLWQQASATFTLDTVLTGPEAVPVTLTLSNSTTLDTVDVSLSVANSNYELKALWGNTTDPAALPVMTAAGDNVSDLNRFANDNVWSLFGHTYGNHAPWDWGVVLVPNANGDAVNQAQFSVSAPGLNWTKLVDKQFHGLAFQVLVEEVAESGFASSQKGDDGLIRMGMTTPRFQKNQYGSVASCSVQGSGGEIFVHALTGSILADDYALDASGPGNTYGGVNLYACQGIQLGIELPEQAAVDGLRSIVRADGTWGNAGRNQLVVYDGDLSLASGGVIQALNNSGVGENAIAACGDFILLGEMNPEDSDTSDDTQPCDVLASDVVIISQPQLNAVVGDIWSYQVQLETPHAEAAYMATRMPRGMRLDPRTGSLVWSPDTDQAGDHEVVIRTTVGCNQTEQAFLITVQ